MKIFLICSKKFYNQIPPILQKLEGQGHQVTLPNSYDDPTMEEKQRQLGAQNHSAWKAKMIKHSEKVIKAVDAVLVLNLKKNGIKNYIGGATFIEMYDACRLGKKIYLYNEIPEGLLHDEILGFKPILINQDLNQIS